MKICSACGLCYDDPVANCSVEDHGVLTKSKNGDCLMVKGYKIISEIKSDFPFKFYKAAHLASEKTVLIKFIKFDSSERSGDQPEAEINKISQINHPNLARVFEFGKIGDDEFYVVSEEIPGQSLREFLENKSPLPERRAIKIARQLAEALEVLHEAGAIHRAVNPSNIYFADEENADFSVKLQNYDFGGIEQKIIAAGANGIDAKTEIYRFFSPEQFTGETVDFKSDLYSLGVVFYELLLGRSPYKFLSPQAISKYVFNEKDVEKLHYDLRALLAYTLKQSLQQRLNLRPPTTNNLSRQFRHLELVAAPPTMGMQEKQANRNKPKQIIKAAPPQKIIAAEETTAQPEIIATPEIMVQPEIIATPEIIENEISAREVVAPATEFAPVLSTEEKAIPMPEFTAGLSANEDVSGEESFETNLETPELSEPSIQTQTENAVEKSSAVEEPEIEYSRETTKLEKNYLNDAAVNFNTTDLSEFEAAFDNIHVTNRDRDEAEKYLPQVFEYEEPEFVEEPPKTEPAPREPQTKDPFISYAAPRRSAFKKTYAYAAAVIVLLVCGGLVAANFWQSRSGQTSAQTAPQKTDKIINVEKKEPLAEPEKIKETVEIAEETAPLPQFDAEQIDDVSTTEEIAVKPVSNKPVQNETAVKIENKPAPLIKEKPSEKTTAPKALKTEPVKKQEKTQPVNIEDIRTTKVIVVGKTKPPVKKTDATGRPRVVTTAPSGN